MLPWEISLVLIAGSIWAVYYASTSLKLHILSRLGLVLTAIGVLMLVFGVQIPRYPTFLPFVPIAIGVITVGILLELADDVRLFFNWLARR